MERYPGRHDSGPRKPRLEGLRSNTQDTRPPLVRLTAFALGLSSAITQLVMFRELLGVLHGNELVLGLLLGNWLLLTALGVRLGSHLGRREPAVALFFCAAPAWIALAPWMQVFAVRLAWSALFIRGAPPGPLATALATFGFMAPYTVASGALLVGCARTLEARANPAKGLATAYVADVLGGVVGGLLFSLLCVWWLDHLLLLLIPATLNVALAAANAIRLGHRRLGLVLGLAGTALVIFGIAGDPDSWTTAQQHAPDCIRFRGHSAYGRLVVTESAGQLSFLENGLPLHASHDVESAEETVHLAMAQRPRARQVLLVGGFLSGSLRELLKYPLDRVICVELDPLLVRAGSECLPGHAVDPRVQVVSQDGRRYVRTTTNRFDVILFDLPDPVTSQLNRYYTTECLRSARLALAPDGVLACAAGRFENYLSPVLARSIAVLVRTLKTGFDNVRVFPAGRLWFLASDSELSDDIAPRLAAAGIRTSYLRPGTLAALFSPDRLATVRLAVPETTPLNTDLNPVLYFLHLQTWLRQYGPLPAWPLAVLAAFGVLYLATLRPHTLTVFTAGFSGALLELVVVLGWQVLYGSVYREMGIILTLFMGGLALGAHLGVRPRRADNARSLARIAIALGLGSVLLWAALVWLEPAASHETRHTLGRWVLGLWTVLFAAGVGRTLTQAAHLDSSDASRRPSRLLEADLAGAVLGAMLAGTVLLPLVGVGLTCGLVAVLNVLAGVLLRARSFHS